jgi:hypothetical protein
MKLAINYKRNPHQKEFDEDLHTKFLHLSSGFAGGKSFALCMKMLRLSQLNAPYSGGLMAPSFKDIKRDIIPIFEDIFTKNNLHPFVRLHKTDFFYEFRWSPGKLYLFSAENQLRGPNLAYFGINEATLISDVRYREAIGRVRVKGARYPQIASVGTPEGVANYMYEMFVESPIPNSRIIYGSTRDNIENLDPGYVSALENSYDKRSLDAYLKGLWVNMNGHQFYYAYSDKNHDKTITELPTAIVHCAMDFNVEYMTATLWHLMGDKLYGFEEIVLEDNADTQKMANALKARGYTPDRTIIYPDPAGAARSTKGQPDHVILRNAGFEVRARSAQPRFRQRQLNVNNLLDKGIVLFNPDKMPTLKKDFEGVEQDPVTLEKSKKNPKLTHASDGFDYMCDILFEFSGKKPTTKIMRVR